MIRQGVLRVNGDVAEKTVLDAVSSETRVFALARRARDKKSLFNAIRGAVPLDPALVHEQDSWDALEDSLWSGLYSIEELMVFVVWSDASEMLRASSADFETAVAILEEVARTLGDPKVTNGPTKAVAFILGGTWP